MSSVVGNKRQSTVLQTPFGAVIIYVQVCNIMQYQCSLQWYYVVCPACKDSISSLYMAYEPRFSIGIAKKKNYINIHCCKLTMPAVT